MFSLICIWTNDWVHNRDPIDIRCHHAYYDFTVMNCLLASSGHQFAHDTFGTCKLWPDLIIIFHVRAIHLDTFYLRDLDYELLNQLWNGARADLSKRAWCGGKKVDGIGRHPDEHDAGHHPARDIHQLARCMLVTLLLKATSLKLLSHQQQLKAYKHCNGFE